MGHQTEVKKLLTKEHAITLLSCLNTMQDNFYEISRPEDWSAARTFSLAYLKAYEVLQTIIEKEDMDVWKRCGLVS